MYTMIAVALYSLVIIVFALTISGLINRVGDLRNEQARKAKREKYQNAPVAKHQPIAVEPEAPAVEPKADPPRKFKASTDFDDVLDSLDK